MESRHSSHGRRWTLLTAMRRKRDSFGQPIHLPMTEESVVAFDTTLDSLRNLAFTALITLHSDIRCGSIHMITRSLAGTNSLKPSDPTLASPAPPPDSNWAHILISEPSTASPAILELNNDLISFHAAVSSYLGPNECRFITSGLARLMDRAFMSATRFIGAMNAQGAHRLQLDVLVLQQNLKNIITDAPVMSKGKANGDENGVNAQNIHEVVALPRSAKFIDWFLEGAEIALENAKEEKDKFNTLGSEKALEAGNGEPFSYDEMRVLIELCFSAILRGPQDDDNREDYMAAKRANGDALLKLSEVMWDS